MSDLDYRMWFRDEDGELKLDRERRFMQSQTVYVSSARKQWNLEEKSTLWKLVLNSKSFADINRKWISKGFTGLRQVHVDLVKRYIKYDAYDAYMENKPLSEVVAVR